MSGSAPRVLWVTGAGSGIGRAVAIRAAAQGWGVILTGRRAEPLRQAADEITRLGGRAVAQPADAGQAGELEAAYRGGCGQLGPATAVVTAAGLNSPQRRWADQSMSGFEQIVRTNLLAVASAVDIALPDLRNAAGSVVVISSYSAWRFTPYAGVAYSASKSALGSICETLNVQEGGNGVRACHLCPGDVDTDFLALRPAVPGPAERSQMLVPDDVARAVQFVLDSPQHVRIDELVIAPVVKS